MTIRFQEPNIFDRILALFGKKRGYVIPSENPYKKWGRYVYYVIPRESFFKALLRPSSAEPPAEVFLDVQEVKKRLEQHENKAKNSSEGD